MEAIRISTERAPAPGGWYSQAYKIGNLIYTAGVTANDPETQKMIAPGDIIGQTEQIMKNMQRLGKLRLIILGWRGKWPS